MDPLVGKTLSHYRIIREIGAGGMGRVYLAHDERLERDVAFKVLSPGILSEESRKRFRKEALALSKLNHPHVATIHDFDTQEGVDFLVMELVSGEPLPERFRDAPPTEDEILRLGKDLAAGLEAIHALGLVHRDLKPGNVRLTPDGRLKILDFGLAKFIGAVEEKPASVQGDATMSVTLTETGSATGTLPYMAPEQLRGGRIDARSDLWAAGLLLYELATGRRAFPERGSAALIASILGQEPTPLRRIRRGLSPALERVIARCLEKDPKARYASASELAADLTRIEQHAPPAPSFGWWIAGGAAVILAAIVLALFLGRGWFGGEQRIRSLAVLPLADLSRDKQDESFAEGMTDELITTLAQLSALKVISRSSVMTFKNASETLPNIARALHADAVLEGSVARSGGRVRITAQLIQATTDEHLWAGSYERELSDVLNLQSDVARSIAQEVRVTLTPREKRHFAVRRAVNPEAHTAYLRGLYAWNRRTTVWLQKAIEYFNQAIEIDPTYAPAYAGIAASYSILPAYDATHAEDDLIQAKAEAYKALALDSTLAEPHAVIAGVLSELDYDQKKAGEEYRKALLLNPNYASAHHWYADYLSEIGRHEEALKEIERAKDVDPLSLIIQTEAGSITVRSGHLKEGIEILRRTVEMDPGFPRSHQTLAGAYIWAGRVPEGIREYEIEDSLLGRRTPEEREKWFGPLKRAFARGGRRAYYVQLLKQRLEVAKTQPVAPISVAVPYAMVGNRDSAFAWLDRAVAAHDPLILRIKVEPVYDSLRTDPRYPKLLRRLGLSG